MWKDLTLQQKAEIMKMSVANGVTDINDIRTLYDGQVEYEFDKGGSIPNQFDDGGFVYFYNSLPKNQQDSTNYNVRRYWELNGKPKDFNEAVQRGMYTKQSDGWHANSVAYNETKDEYEFMKSPTHPTTMYEIGAYMGNKDFQKNYYLDYTSKPNYKYKRKPSWMYNNGGHLFDDGGYKSSPAIRKRISNWEGSSMYAPAPDTGKVNRPFSAEERDFWRVIPNDIKPLLTQDMADALFSTSYNIGAGNFKKRVVPQLRRVLIDGTGTVEDITNSMYGTRDKEPKMKGLRTRRATERKLFTDAYNTAYLNNVPQVDSNALYTPAQELRWNKPISQPTFRPLQMPQAPMQISMPRVETTPITPIEERVPISDTLPNISPLLLSLPDQQGFTPHRMVTPQYQPVNLNLDSPYLLFRS